MRKKFSELLLKHMKQDPKIILLTGDLGYGLWDEVRSTLPQQFVNVGSAEQLMIGMAVGMALDKKIPVVYSITPFLLYRPFEFIRNYIHNEEIPVKLVGGGRGDDYKKLGYTHLAPEDSKVMDHVFTNVIHYRPEKEEWLERVMHSFIYAPVPSYMSLKK